MSVRDPFEFPPDLHVAPAYFRTRPLDFELGDIWVPLTAKGQEGQTLVELCWMGNYGDLWSDSIGGEQDGARTLRRLFERNKGPETNYRLTLRGDKAAWTPRTLPPARDHVHKERRLSLVVHILRTEGRRNNDIGVCIRIALDVENLAHRRDDAMRQGLWLGLLQGAGVRGERALEALTAKTRWNVGTVRKNRARPIVAAVIASFSRGGTIKTSMLPHVADPWFAEGVERQIALGIAYRAIECIKRGEHPAETLRWATLVLCEGHWRRHRNLPQEAIYALAACLELLDGDGRPRRDLPLAGVSLRRQFVELAGHEARKDWDGLDTDWYHERDQGDPASERSWRAHPFFLLIKEDARRMMRANGA